MIFDMTSSKELFEQFYAAQATEGAAITALHDTLTDGVKDNDILMALTNRMTEAHNKKMAIWDQLQQHRLDACSHQAIRHRAPEAPALVLWCK